MIVVSLRKEQKGANDSKRIEHVVREFVAIPGAEAWEEEIGRLFKGEDGFRAAYALAM